jgi:triosephosphate isomerase
MHDLTDSLLHLNNYLFLVVAYDLNQMQTNHLDDIENLYQYARQNHYAIYLLTGSTVNDAADFIQKTGLHIPVCTTDPTTLKTVIRSNPGLMLLYNGSVLNKWANASLPQFSKPLSNNPKDEMPKIPPMWKVVGLALLYILLFGGMRHWLKKGFKSKKRSNIFYHTTTNYSNK